MSNTTRAYIPFLAALATLGSSMPLGSPQPYNPRRKSSKTKPERAKLKAARAARRLDKRSRRK